MTGSRLWALGFGLSALGSNQKLKAESLVHDVYFFNHPTVSGHAC